MNVKELIEELQKLPSTLEVMKATDDEGNSYIPIGDAVDMMKRADGEYFAECMDIVEWEKEVEEEYKDQWERVVVIW